MESKTSDNTAALTAPSGGALLNAEQAASYLNLSESYVRKATGRNALPFVKIGTRVLFRRADLDSWVQERVVPTNSAIQDRAEGLAATAMLRTPRTRRSVA